MRSTRIVDLLAVGVAAVGLTVLVLEAPHLGLLGPATGALVLSAACLLLPTRVLPVLMLAALVLIPVTYLNAPRWLVYFPPCVLVGVVCAVRSRRTRLPLWRQCGLSASLLAVWLVVSSVSGVSPKHSLLYAFSVGVALGLPLFLAVPGSARMFEASWAALTALLAVFAVLEKQGRANPLDAMYGSAAPFPLVQHWASYRVFTTLGHPLVNAMFFAVSAVFLFGRWRRSGQRLKLVASGLAMVGVLCTDSRAGLAALAVGIAWEVVASLRHSRRGLAALLLTVVMGTGLWVGVVASSFSDRAQSVEAVDSATSRGSTIHVGLEAARQRSFLGSGPATSVQSVAPFAHDEYEARVENSLLQLLISTGFPGVVLLGAYCLSFLRACRGLGSAACLVTVLVAAAGFNMVEAYPALLTMLALPLLAAALLEADHRAVGQGLAFLRDESTDAALLS